MPNNINPMDLSGAPMMNPAEGAPMMGGTGDTTMMTPGTTLNPDQSAVPGQETAAPFGMSPEQMKTDLDSMYDRVKSKERQVNSRRLMDSNSLRSLKAKLIQVFFEFMQSKGVDPNDMASINKFLGGLYDQDPDLYELFAFAFEGLFNEENMKAKTVGTPVEPGLNDRFQNLQQQMMRFQE